MGDNHRRALPDAMTWVENAHDVTGRNGISAGYDLNHGWQPAHPETGGHLIPTMLRAAETLRRPELGVRAREVGEWLEGFQSADGAYPGGVGVDGDPIVFDVGQIMLGLIELWRATGKPSTLDSVNRAAHWLRRAQELSGAWLSHFDYPNTFSSRVTWALLDLWRETADPGHLACAERSVEWMLRQADTDGWIAGMGFHADQTPWTHTIAYALRGLLGCGDLLDGEHGTRTVEAAERCASRLADLHTSVYFLLPGEIGNGFEPKDDYACLAGDAQMVTIWLDLAQRNEDACLRRRCAEVADRLVEVQVQQPIEPVAVGALPGSWPLTEGFEPLAFPSLSTKFLADVILNLACAEEKLLIRNPDSASDATSARRFPQPTTRFA